MTDDALHAQAKDYLDRLYARLRTSDHAFELKAAECATLEAQLADLQRAYDQLGAVNRRRLAALQRIRAWANEGHVTINLGNVRALVDEAVNLTRDGRKGISDV